MIIKSRLTKEQFTRLSIWRHIQRKTFYFYALTCAALTAIAYTQGIFIWALVGWLPFSLYVLIGFINASRDGADPNQPLFLPTSYEFKSKGLTVKTAQGSSELDWSSFSHWQIMTKCYILVLKNDAVLAIPQTSIPLQQRAKFEGLLHKYIGE